MAGKLPASGKFAFNVWTDPPLKSVSKWFASVGHQMEKPDYKPAWKKLVPVLSSEFEKVWATNGGSIGESWPPLTALYAKYYNQGSTARDLLLEGKLREAATTTSKSKGAVRRYGKKSMKWGVSLPQAKAMNFGFGPKRAGRAPFIGVNDRIRSAAALVLSEHVGEMIQREWRKVPTASRMVGR